MGKKGDQERDLKYAYLVRWDQTTDQTKVGEHLGPKSGECV